jgi:hypothetical protein
MTQSPFFDHTDAEGNPRNARGGLCLPPATPAVVKGVAPIKGQPMLPIMAEIPIHAHDKRTARLAQQSML